MGMNGVREENSGHERGLLFTRSFLSGLRRKALQGRVWYSALDKVERGIVNLSIRLIDSVQSETLGIEIVKISKKVRDAMRSPFVAYLENHSLSAALKLAKQAADFGNKDAREWVYDFGFTRYLALMNHDKASGWVP